MSATKLQQDYERAMAELRREHYEKAVAGLMRSQQAAAMAAAQEQYNAHLSQQQVLNAARGVGLSDIAAYLRKAGQLPEPPKFPTAGVGPDQPLDENLMDQLADTWRLGDYTMADTMMTPVGVLSFPALFEPKPNDRGEKRYQLNIIFDADAQKTDAFKKLKAAVDKELQEFFRGKVPSNAHYPIQDCAPKSDYAGYEKGSVYISAWTKSKPGIVGPSREEITIPDDVWAGQLARATVKPFAWDTAGKKGASFMLNNVQIAKLDAPRLDGRKKATDEFDALDEATDDDSPF